MSIPTYFDLMLPVLSAISDKKETRVSEIRRRVAISENLTQDDLAESISRGVSRFGNRVGWALSEMLHAQLINRKGWGVYQITERGSNLLADSPSGINRDVLRGYQEYLDWEQNFNRNTTTVANEESNQTPYEALNNAFSKLNNLLESEALERVHNSEPIFLERLIVELLIAMGYGRGNPDRGKVTASSGDGGIDGVISEDTLGLDEVYIQAKKYAANNPVGEPELRDFVGAIDTKGTSKGVFVTTSSFTKPAEDYVKKCSKKIVLIDGNELARLMVEYGVGFRSETTYQVKRIDEDYFES